MREADDARRVLAQGDTLRDWKNDGKPLWWKVYGRNKKSICLDLKNPDDKQRLLDLVPQAQVLVESFRHGAMEAFGLGPDDLAAPGRGASERLGVGLSLLRLLLRARTSLLGQVSTENRVLLHRVANTLNANRGGIERVLL